MYLLYHADVPSVKDHAGDLCPDLYQRRGIQRAGSVGHPGIYDDDHTAEFSVCLCGQPDCPWNDRNFPDPFFVPERFVSGFHLCASGLFCGKFCVLCGADRGRYGGGALHRGIFRYLPEISERGRAADGDQSVTEKR